MHDQSTSTRFGTTTEWTASTLILGMGEIGYDTTLKTTKTGDGVSTWAQLTADDTDDTVLTAPNGTKYRLVVSNVGAVTAVTP